MSADDHRGVGADVVDAFQSYLRELRSEIDGIDLAELGWRPAPDTTPISNLVLHILGAMKVGFSVLAGDPRERDREAEFAAAPLPAAALVARISAAEDELERYRDLLTAADLAALRHRPARNFRGSGLTVVLTNWGHAIEHLAQIRLTRQLYAFLHRRPAG